MASAQTTFKTTLCHLLLYGQAHKTLFLIIIIIVIINSWLHDDIHWIKINKTEYHLHQN